MSIQSYMQQVSFDDRIRNVGEALPALTKTGIALECQVDIMVTRGFDKTSKRSSTFTVVGENGDLMGAIQAGSIMASNIAKLSSGVMCGFYCKMGKYRNDEIPQDVATGDNSYTVITLTNSQMDSYNYDFCLDGGRKFVAKVVSTNIIVPWVRNDVSDADVEETMEGFEQTIDGKKYTLGYVRFSDDNKVSMTAYPCRYMKYIATKRKSRFNPSFLNNNDSELGIVPDDVLSETENTVIGGFDDGVEPEPSNP